MALSKREKILLFVLAFVAVVFLGVRFLLMPVYDELNQKKSSLQAGAINEQLAKADVAGAAGIQRQYDSAEQKAVGTAQAFFPNLKSDDLNKWLKTLTDKYGLTVVSMAFSNPAPADIAGTSSVAASSGYPIQQFADSFLQNNSSGVAASSGASSAQSSSASANSQYKVLESDIKVELGGTKSAAEAFLDAIPKSGRTAVVTESDITGVFARLKQSNQIIQVWGFSVTISCYSVEKLDTSDQTVTWDSLTGA